MERGSDVTASTASEARQLFSASRIRKRAYFAGAFGLKVMPTGPLPSRLAANRSPVQVEAHQA